MNDAEDDARVGRDDTGRYHANAEHTASLYAELGTIHGNVEAGEE